VWLSLNDLAYTRSGDKGDVSNVGIMAIGAREYQALRRWVTPERVKAHFGALVTGPVHVYELPRIESLQVVMHGALGGGATQTLRFDETGKSMAALMSRLQVPAALLIEANEAAQAATGQSTP
jgi:hypothetical protein